MESSPSDCVLATSQLPEPAFLPESQGAPARGDQDETFSALDRLEFLTVQGEDRSGNVIIRVLGRGIPAKTVPPEDLRSYVLHFVCRLLADLGSEERFCVVYFHSGCVWEDNCPGVLWLQGLWNDLPARFRQRTTAAYVVHPGFALRAGLWLLGSWLADRLYSKIAFISRLEFLDEFVDLESGVEVPDYVCEHDELLEHHPLMDYGFQLDPLVSRAQMPHVAEGLETRSHICDEGGPNK